MQKLAFSMREFPRTRIYIWWIPSWISVPTIDVYNKFQPLPYIYSKSTNNPTQIN